MFEILKFQTFRSSQGPSPESKSPNPFYSTLSSQSILHPDPTSPNDVKNQRTIIEVVGMYNSYPHRLPFSGGKHSTEFPTCPRTKGNQ